MLREDLQNGTFAEGQRLIELNLAAQYGVSRTPVREALFQLAREGLLEESDRGYSLPSDTHDDFLDRLAVRLSLDPTVAAHAAARATHQQKLMLEKYYGQMCGSHATGKLKQFVDSAHRFDVHLIAATHNNALIRVARILEDQFLIMRNKHYQVKENRDISVRFVGLLLDAIMESSPETASEVARTYMAMLINRFTDGQLPDSHKPYVASRDTPTE